MEGWESDRPLLIGIAGGSGSGKSTIAQALAASIDRIALIQHDAYYRHRPDLTLEQRAALNYDHPDSLETDLLVLQLRDLRAGRKVLRPVYDFAAHLRSHEEVEVLPGAVIVVEGILVLAEPDLRKLFDLKIYVDTDPDLRLARRLRRDIVERGRTVNSVLAQYESTVRPMHLEFVEPSKRYADLIIPEGYNPGAVRTVIEMIRSQARQ